MSPHSSQPTSKPSPSAGVGAPEPSGQKPDPYATPPRGLPFTRVGPLGVVITFAAVILAFIVLGWVANSSSTPKSDKAPGTSGNGPESDQVGSPRIELIDDATAARIAPDEISQETQDALVEWFQAVDRKPINDRSDGIEEEWAKHVASYDVASPLERLPRFVFRPLADRDKIRDEPGSRRGFVCGVLGKIESIDRVAFPGIPGDPVWSLRLVDEQGDRFRVICTKEPPVQCPPGRWIRACGTFVKLVPPSEPSGKPGFLVFASQAVVPSFEPRRVDAIDPAWKEQVVDRTESEAMVQPGQDGDALWLLLNYARTMGPEGYRAKLESGALKFVDFDRQTGASKIAKDPEPHRFDLVRIRVSPVIHTWDTEGIETENAGQISSVYRGIVADDLTRPIKCISAFPESEWAAMQSSRSGWIEGFFYKRVATESKSGKKFFLPVLVATRYLPAERPVVKTDFVSIIAWTVVVSAFLLLVLYLVLRAKQKREREAVVRRHEERVSRRKSAGREP